MIFSSDIAGFLLASVLISNTQPFFSCVLRISVSIVRIVRYNEHLILPTSKWQTNDVLVACCIEGAFFKSHWLYHLLNEPSTKSQYQHYCQTSTGRNSSGPIPPSLTLQVLALTAHACFSRRLGMKRSSQYKSSVMLMFLSPALIS